MAKSPASFRDVADLRAYLGSAEVHACVGDFLRAPRWTLEDVVRRSVEGTTFRAFAIKRYGASPALLYRGWLREYLEAHLADFLRAPDAAAYQEALDRAVAALQGAWRLETGGQDDLGYGRAAKLLNLSLKHVLLLDELDEPQRSALFGRLHVALDRFTLGPLAPLAPALGLGRAPSMGAVKTREAYLDIQCWIADVCADAGIPPIQYEFATFNVIRDGMTDAGGVAGSGAARATANPIPVRRPRPEGTGDGVRPAGSPPGRAPRVDARARVVRTRHVENATVIHSTAASHRGAVFQGTIEVADEAELAVLETPGSDRRIQGKLLWFGRAPKTRHPSISIDGEWRVERGYSGPVVAEVGRVGPPRRSAATRS